MYDMEHSGSINEDDLYRLLERGHETCKDLNGAGGLLEQHGLAVIDLNGDGRISHDEFLQAVQANPKLLELFGQVVH